MSKKERVDLSVCGESLRLRVERDEVERVQRGADILREKIAEYEKAGGATNLRIAVLAALDVAHELVRERDGVGSAASQRERERARVSARLDSAIRRIDETLGDETVGASDPLPG